MFYDKYKVTNKNGKGVTSGEKKKEARFADKALSSWTGLGRSGHVQITTFHQFSHISGLEITF